MDCFPAHIRDDNGIREIQTVREHSENVAKYASEKLSGVGLTEAARLGGLLHDMGKYTEKFKNYVTRAANGENVVRGSVNHTFASVIYLLEHFHKGKKQSFETLTAEIIAFAVGSHHGEFDIVSLDGESGFSYRMEKDRDELCYDEAVKNYLTYCADETEITRLFLLATAEITALFSKLKTEISTDRKKMSFLMGMAARLLLSALTDADRRDTAEYMSGKPFNPTVADKKLWNGLLSGVEDKLSEFKSATAINRSRKYFSEKCREFGASHGSGIYRLSLPTGAGKTLSALRYSLVNAANFGKKRIIFVIPLLTILEQNRKVIREYISDQSIITEHHSNFLKEFDSREELDRYELLAETWDSPIIITTLVQLLNSLFSGKMSAVRRMSALADSVIVIDEVQSLPQKTFSMFNMAINFLACCCGATVVLSSATQPCLDVIKNEIKYSEPRDIVPFDKEIFGVFERTRVIDKTDPYGMDAEELSDFAAENAEAVNSLLIICNTKRTALLLYKALSIRCREHVVFHLSASMCMGHREDMLEKINKALSDKVKTICVATQLVEAGVDFSFERVIRVIAGMDSIAQAAGRCNRNGDFGKICDVFVVNLKKDAENLRMLKEIETAQRCTSTLLADFREHAEGYEYDLLDNKSIERYYSLLFSDESTRRLTDYPAKSPNGVSIKLFDLLSDNPLGSERPSFSENYFMKQAAKTAGDLFEVFDENTIDVIVPYNDEAKEIIATLFSEKAKFDYNFMKETLERAKPYLIKLYEYQRRALSEKGMLHSDEHGYFTALNKLSYDKETGLEIDNLLL